MAAILLACVIGLHVVGKAAELTALKRNEHALDTSITQTFRMAMPGEQSTLDARRKMEQRLAAAQSGGTTGGFLPALQALVQARNVAPGTTLQALSFRQGMVDTKLTAQDAASLDHVRQSLQANGLSAEMTSGNATPAGRYEGRIQFRAK